MAAARREALDAAEEAASGDEAASSDEDDEGAWETESWACPLFDGETVELELGNGISGYRGVHKASNSKFIARKWVNGKGYAHVHTSADPRECAAMLARWSEDTEAEVAVEEY